jgi:hypothetical protein
MKLISVVIVLLLAIGTSLAAQDRTTKLELSALAWMAGTWTGVTENTEMEEQWTVPKGGIMLGIHRDVRDGRAVSFEFIRIQESADGVTYWASPNGKPATPFRAIEIAGQRVVFENKEHDFPQRVIYRLTSDGMLHARIEGTIKGKLESEEWVWKKVD